VSVTIWEEVFPEHLRVDPDAVTGQHCEQGGAMDEATFQAFYQKTAPLLRSYLRRVCSDGAFADDLLQESFYRFLRTPSLSKDETQWKAYLYKIATHLTIDHGRRLKREGSWFPKSGSGEDAPIDSIADRGDLGREVILSCDLARVFQQLKPLERALLWLAYVEGAEHREIADTLGLKEKSSRVLLFRARHKLAGLLRRKGLGSEVKP
jgi:RNA polymerase sigma-70 factor (ECF subfamily)